jgi:prepilin-type processing-associated H-X9-DG protein
MPPTEVKTFAAELRDAVTPRSFGMVTAVLLLQLGFILSYVGAFHHQSPHRISIAVVAPASAATSTVAQLNRLPGEPLAAVAARSEADARRRIADRTNVAALVVNPAGRTDTLLVAGAAGVSESTAVQAVMTQVEKAQGRTLTVTDLVPLQPGDGRGLTSFYLVIGWIVGGYLAASILGTAAGTRPTNRRRATIRLGAMVLYSIFSGLGGAIIVDSVLGALTGHFLAIWAIGILVVFASAAASMGLQVVLGIAGIGAVIILFVVLGNPSAGGAYQPALLPAFWRAISSWLPNGAGNGAVRNIVYFDGHALTLPLIVLGLWALGGAVVTIAGAGVKATIEADEAQPSA